MWALFSCRCCVRTVLSGHQPRSYWQPSAKRFIQANLHRFVAHSPNRPRFAGYWRHQRTLKLSRLRLRLYLACNGPRTLMLQQPSHVYVIIS
ncbi:uncharacterized protein F5147DRAFT_728304 [Suillus discolor]|uniref:Uncharacterized protein n=1 Tax=Suillus discolor TaxID=1912936 RepID=A0A9P7ERN4_9AGAM|nr:uncharacterized protein F5147DRAFT_728304 [Suillus discolor]KAG2087130.1 hypothetical protein F5147DRAFT_728304 [Suillus discolor]